MTNQQFYSHRYRHNCRHFQKNFDHTVANAYVLLSGLPLLLLRSLAGPSAVLARLSDEVLAGACNCLDPLMVQDTLTSGAYIPRSFRHQYT